MKRIDHNVKYIAFAASGAALLWLAHAGLFPIAHPFNPGQHLVETDPTSVREQKTLRTFFRRPDVIIALTFVFATAGPTLTLPADFNTASNQINAIGSGVGGTGSSSIPLCCCLSNQVGGNGGGGGAFSQIVNYNGHSAGQVVNCTVGAGDTIFDTNLILLAKAGSGQTGGQAASGVGTTKSSGGNGGTGGNGGGINSTGGGGGGAAGPHGAGNNGANGINTSSPPGTVGGAGATGDAGNTPSGANGTQFDGTHGSGGGGNGGGVTAGFLGVAGSNGGSFGGGGGGGGVDGGNVAGGGNGFQGLIAIGYTPAVAATTRSYGFFLG